MELKGKIVQGIVLGLTLSVLVLVASAAVLRLLAVRKQYLRDVPSFPRAGTWCTPT